VIYSSYKKESGVVLITALIMIIAVSGIAVSLMSSSTTDLKVLSGAQDREVASNRVKGDTQRTIGTEKTAGINSDFYRLKGQFEAQTNKNFNISAVNSQSTVLLYNENDGPTLLKCLPRLAVTPSLKCNYLRMEATLKYGKQDTNGDGKHKIEIHSGIVQALGTSGKSL
jgi:type IV pilus assembly protein PilX